MFGGNQYHALMWMPTFLEDTRICGSGCVARFQFSIHRIVPKPFLDHRGRPQNGLPTSSIRFSQCSELRMMMFCVYLWIAAVFSLIDPTVAIYRHPVARYDQESNEVHLHFEGNDLRNYSLDVVWESFRNKRFAMMGDSLSRYQFLDLAYFLVNHKWPDAHDNLCNERAFGNWTNFFIYTTTAFKHQDIGETFRNGSCGGWNAVDNRQIYIPELNTTIWFFQWFGRQNPPRGHYNIKEGLKRLPCHPANCHEFATNHSWVSTPSKFLYDFVVAHQPDYFFLNCGLHASPFDKAWEWGVEQGVELNHTMTLLKNIPNLKTRVIWKSVTPTFYRGDLVVIKESVIEDLHRNNMIEVYNASEVVVDMMNVHLNITEGNHKDKRRVFYWDGGAHFHCWVYSQMNIDLAARYFLNADEK